MAKNKKAKQTKKMGLSDIYIEIIGIGLIVLSVLMLGQLGLIGTSLRGIGMLLFGDFFWFVAIMVIIHSGKMIITRKVPNLLTTRNVGCYLILTALITLSHLLSVYRHFEVQQIPPLRGIWSYYLTNDVLSPDFVVGGGVVGAFICALFVPLITWMGLFGLSSLVLFYGVLLFFNLTIKDLYDRRKERSKKEREPIFKGRKTPKKVKESKKPSPEKSAPASAEKKEADEEKRFKISDFTEQIEKDQGKEKEAPDQELDFAVGSQDELDYALPPLELLIDHKQSNQSQKMLVTAKTQARKLEDTFKNFDVKAKIGEIHIGPAVTKFEILPDTGVKVSKIISLTDDIALALAAKGIRMEAPIPGKSAIGIEVPNPKQTLITFKEILKEVPGRKQKEKLLMVLGRDISGEIIYSSLNKMPHLLVAGATGSGKSVCINTMICSILMRSTPQEVKMLLIDPKKVELGRYNHLPHLLAPVVTDARLASLALKKIIDEMESRYELFSESGVRDIESYNDYVTKVNEDPSTDTPKSKLAYIVVVIDELADLMMVASKEVEESIMRLTQMARAAGIHLVVATQRPSVDVITGVIKSNVPSRIAFGVSSAIDSRTILDMAGAEKLLGKGDMLFLPMGSSNPVRVQGAFISDEEVARVVEFIKGQVQTELKQDFLGNLEQVKEQSESPADPLMKEVLAYIFETKKVSASLLQRRFRIGYNRAARLVEELEARGLIGASEGNKPREVLMTEEQYHEYTG